MERYRVHAEKDNPKVCFQPLWIRAYIIYGYEEALKFAAMKSNYDDCRTLVFMLVKNEWKVDAVYGGGERYIPQEG